MSIVTKLAVVSAIIGDGTEKSVNTYMATQNNATTSLVKTPYVKTHFASQNHLDQFIKCCDPLVGYLYFMDNFFQIQHPTKGAIAYHPYGYQKRLIHNYHTYTHNVALLPRQSGKTISAAGYLLWYAMFVPDSTVLIAAHKYTGAQEIMQRIRYSYENCPDHIKAGVVTYNKGSLDFENGSRIVSATTTETTGRGMSISLLYCLSGETTVKIRNKTTQIEEEISLQDLFNRLYMPKIMLSDDSALV